MPSHLVDVGERQRGIGSVEDGGIEAVDHVRQPLDGHRAAQQEALHVVAAERGEFRQLTRRLHALGDDVDLDDGIAAARRCGIMLLAQMKAALGSLDRVERIVKLGVLVNSSPDFTDQPKVANGASELMQDVFGEAGRHARSAVGVPVLPLGVAVEVDAVVQVRAA